MDEKNVDDVVEETTEEELEANETDNALDTEEPEVGDEEAEIETGTDFQDDGDARAERARNQINRLKEEVRRLKSERSGEKGGQKGDEPQVASSDLLYRTYLGQQGYTNRDVQDKAIDRAKRLGMSVDQLIADPDEKAVLDAAVQRIKATNASARPTGKGGGSKKDAQWYVDHNQLPEDPSMRVAVWDILAAQERR